MATRKALNVVAASIADIFVSRNNDLNGSGRRVSFCWNSQIFNGRPSD
jgi:hypothetical protein